MSLFSVVRFKNQPCTGEGGAAGVCYTAQACLAGGGRAAGECADGFGVCCVTRLSCGASTSNNCSILQSPGYPATFNYPTTCTHTVTFPSNVCQIRLDVVTVDLAPPTSQGTCYDDSLTFSQDTKWGRVCGTTTDSHFYLDVDSSASTSLTLTFTTGQREYDRRWQVKATQITCDQLSMAPTGCGQYFTSPSGVIKGWNHDGIYLSGQNYAICVRKEVDMCSTTYQDSRSVLFRPICGDTLEWPFPVIGAPTTTVSCVTAAAFIASTPLTVPLQGPNYLYLVTTTDTTNDHSDATNVFYTYTQNPC
ncbi:uncharacterized protein LOC135090275 isoform X2 [Scylla paramamosain]|uniref:uncharacterized protein LOC135090275 isoform X2 n=1 Tax=Scylla paramamosain TaxID=85552 RepID=UPI003083BC22